VTDDVSGAALDVPTLRTLAQRAAGHPLVEGWTFEPDAMTPRSLAVRLDSSQYPPAVTAVRLDVRWFENDDYTVHYVETRDGDAWQCRWDSHPKPGESRAHFHPPPDADGVESSPLSGSGHLDVLFSVLDWASDRLERLHDRR
jgi:hypothetical protein